jgi:hypothetical protein
LIVRRAPPPPPAILNTALGGDVVWGRSGRLVLGE